MHALFEYVWEKGHHERKEDLIYTTGARKKESVKIERNSFHLPVKMAIHILARMKPLEDRHCPLNSPLDIVILMPPEVRGTRSLKNDVMCKFPEKKVQ